MSNNEREVLLEVKNLKQYFKINHHLTVKAIDDISFKVYKGETFVITHECILLLHEDVILQQVGLLWVLVHVITMLPHNVYHLL